MVLRLTLAVVIQAWIVLPVPFRKSGSPEEKPRKRRIAIFGWPKTRSGFFDPVAVVRGAVMCRYLPADAPLRYSCPRERAQQLSALPIRLPMRRRSVRRRELSRP